MLIFWKIVFGKFKTKFLKFGFWILYLVFLEVKRGFSFILDRKLDI